MLHATLYTEADIWQLLENVPDPEVPVLSVVDLGVIRAVEVNDDPAGQVACVTITPTYSGCPAMDMIAAGVKMELLMQGLVRVEIKQQLSPAWTTDWMSENGKHKLKAYGIAPPAGKTANYNNDYKPTCPQCGSANTEMVSHFGSTACKALYKCLSCLEPFDYFKCH
jgi:ring-1,2-phenylacetyl-CoA epoxidase subunit PaaD